jgi:RNA polymerase sigma-70 factor, ECF subfamily
VPFLRSRPGLLAAFRRGDRAALEEVYWAYVDVVEIAIRRGHAIASKGTRVPGAAPDAVADSVQETFLRAFREGARSAYDGVREYGPYLRTIARNVLVDRARSERREIPVDDLAPMLDATEAPDEPWADAETMRIVEDYIASLDDELRSIHEARYVRGLSQNVAAETLGITRQTVRTLEARLREGLARRIKNR